MAPAARSVLSRTAFPRLLEALRERGYRVVGPTIRDGAIVYDDIRGVDDLPAGWTEEQEAGRYRLARRPDQALFGYAVGPHSWKQFFLAPRVTLWRARRSDGGFEVLRSQPAARPLALVGARSCDLHAVAIQDRILVHDRIPDEDYAARRAGTFVVAVNCAVAGGTCFCVSMQTGPRATGGFDLALTELLDGGHRFLVEVGSEEGAALLAQCDPAPAAAEDVRSADRVVDETARSMGRTLDTGDIKDLLYRNLEHPRWDDVAGRCLACTNCTLACPTCFCTSIEDSSDLAGDEAERTRRWDSCFTLGHSYVHGGSVRASIRSRYRQWLVHKVASWIDQFGGSGCVGCGRCITWCPVGIDLTEEIAAIRATDGVVGPGTP
jgi:sulfhydrogenase subunit beta (sulfur reductase)